MNNYEILDNLQYDALDIDNLEATNNSLHFELERNLSHLLLFGCITMHSGQVIYSSTKNLTPKITECISNSSMSLKDYVYQINGISEYQNNNGNLIDKSSMIEHIIAFETLYENWDGLGAIPLEVKSAANAIRLINYLDEVTAPIDYFPNPNGTISFIWENSNKEKLSLEIGKNSLSFYTKFSSMPVNFYNNLSISDETFEDIKSNIQSLA